MEVFKLRATLEGHEKDVRGVCGNIFPADCIISGSRDQTTRLWIENGENASFTEGSIMGGHEKFVSCVCVTPPDAMYPQGLIMTGSNDKTILAYTLDSPEPLFKLEGHGDTVCSLAAGKFGSVISGSWDKTAKVWLNKKCVMTLSGHEAAVWAVAIMPEGGYMLSGSADKSIKLWRAGKCEQTFTGHADCVRGLAVLSVDSFLSCSNDASVRRWLTSGECLQTLYGHTNFIYSIATFPDSHDFVTTSEDRTLKVWRGGECKQTITHPCTSVWCVCVLQNGDIVTGGSDGVVRVFTCAAERMADEEAQAAYEQQLSNSSIPAQIGDLKTEELPPATALLNPGKRDGQTMMVRNGDKIEAHNWSAAEGRWVKVGDVVGGSGGTQTQSGKQLYQGKEYDYVFDVELDVEGRPTKLKLPYNAGGDPWMAAHNFLEENDISQMYLDQVAKFIMDQTKGVTIGVTNTGGSSDPFTGAGRYIPGTAPPPQGAGSTDGYDPFTGGGRYVPSYGDAPQQQQPVPVKFVKGEGKDQCFPKTTYLSFDSANESAIIGKLKELRAGSGAAVEDAALEQLPGLISGQAITAPALHTLDTLLQWPPECRFPALDVLRLCLRHKDTSEHFCGAKEGTLLTDYLLKCLSRDQPTANRMLALRALTNLFSQPPGEALMGKNREQFIPALLANAPEANKNIQIAAASVLLNYAVSLHKQPDIEGKSQLVCAAAELSSHVADPEAHFRLLVALGTLINRDSNATELAKSMDLQVYTTKCSAIFEPKKVSECAQLVAKQL